VTPSFSQVLRVENYIKLRDDNAAQPTIELLLANWIELILVQTQMPVPVAARAKAYVSGRSPAGVLGSNPTVGIDFFCCACCVL
jgi:hypothetical protein